MIPQILACVLLCTIVQLSAQENIVDPISFISLQELNTTNLERELEVERRRDAVKQSFIHTWKGYEKYAFGYDQLRPVSNLGSNLWGGFGITLVDAIDTLIIMNLQEELNYQRIRDHVSKINWDKDWSGNVFEVTIRYLGGLLGAYALTKDLIYKQKATELADRLLHAFNTRTGIPHTDLNFHTLQAKTPHHNGGAAVLSEFGGIQLEFKYLSYILDNPIYSEKVSKIQDVLESTKRAENENGLLPVHFHPSTGVFTSDHITFGAYGDSYYEYLLKQWILTNKTETRYRVAFDNAMDGLFKVLLKSTTRSKISYIAQWKRNRLEHTMDHLVCFVPGMLMLASRDYYPNSELYVNVAKEILDTCYLSYETQATGLGPEIIRFATKSDIVEFSNHASHYILRPETVESLFMMYRHTKDSKYQDWGWKIFQSLEKHCKTGSGYSGIKDVGVPEPVKDDAMQSYFLSETLKYLYLLFSDDSLLPLDKWVFTTEGHPFPIWDEGNKT